MGAIGLFAHTGAFLVVVSIILLAITGAATYDVDANVALEWGARNGYKIGSLKAAELPGRPRGFVATKDIKVREMNDHD